MRQVVVIGAGIGGLSAAVALASGGCRVTVLEAMSRPGGKAGTAEADGVRFDTGPSVLTLPDAFDAVLQRAGMRLSDMVTLRAPSPGFRYLWPDGTRFDVMHARDATVASAVATFGADAGDQLTRFLARAERIWQAASPHFVLGPAPAWTSLLRPGALAALPHIDALRTMEGAIRRDVREPHLRDVLLRYATYNGSDPRRAPATLNCIAHVELALGGFGVEGGIHALVEALVAAGSRVGVELRLGCAARGLEVAHGRVVGVKTDDGRVDVDAVVLNADVGTLAAGLLPEALRTTVPPPRERSTSGWTGVLRARRGGAPNDAARPRVAHTVLFPTRFAGEFEDLFDQASPPRDPAVYLCAQEAAHGRSGWTDAEPVFVMANAPAGASSAACVTLRDRVLERLDAAGLRAADDALVWERDVAGLAAEHPGSDGALYGAASNDAFAAFRRPSNRVSAVAGLYLASGSAHPGGGLPLCARSGLAAADAVLAGA